MIELGLHNTLRVIKFEPQGAYLGDDSLDSILLPTKYIPEGLKVDDELVVFVYNDSEQRPIATTLTPLVTLHQFAALKVKSVTTYGAFMDWGLAKDLFVPFSEQRAKLEEGKRYLVYLYLDEQTNRLVGSTKLNKFLRQRLITVKDGDEVDLIVWHRTELGTKVIVNGRYGGLLYANETFKKLKLGQQLTGYVKKLRDDGHMDITLEKPGYASVEPNAQRVLEAIEAAGGHLELHDKSAPEQIYAELQMSKKLFKKALGSLYKAKTITIEEDGIRLAEKS